MTLRPSLFASSQTLNVDRPWPWDSCLDRVDGNGSRDGSGPNPDDGASRLSRRPVCPH